ncbi:MAG TPA: nucleotidyltransferase family protein [Longimicrobium sp.]
MPRHPPLLPEAELLLLAARGPEGDERFRALLDTGLDWDRVAARVERDRAHAAFWRRAAAAGLERIPPEPRERLRRLGQVAAFRQARLEERLGQALGVLEGAGVEVLLLKGAALAVSVYGSFAERPMADLDLLVPADQAEEAQRLLLEAGWVRAAPVPAERLDALYAGHHHLAPLADAGGTGVVLELHTAPLPPGHPFRLDAADLWRESLPVRVGARAARVPDLHHQVLHLCLHFAWAHAMESGAWRTLRDLRALSAREGLDWGRVAALARDARGASCAYWALRLARGLVGARVPDGVLEALAPRGSRWRLDLLERHFVATLFGGARCPSPRVTRALWEAAVAPGRSGHGAARPWLRQEAFAEAGIAAVDAGARASAWGDFAGWRRYLGTLLFAAQGGVGVLF